MRVLAVVVCVLCASARSAHADAPRSAGPAALRQRKPLAALGLRGGAAAAAAAALDAVVTHGAAEAPPPPPPAPAVVAPAASGPADAHQMGPLTLVTVDDGYSAVTEDNGKQCILDGGATYL